MPSRSSSGRQVVTEIRELTVEVCGRKTTAGPVDAEQAHTVVEGIPAGRFGNLAARAGRAMEPQDVLLCARRTPLGDAEEATVAHGTRPS